MSTNCLTIILIILSLSLSAHLKKYSQTCKSWDKVSRIAEDAKESYSMTCSTNSLCIGMNCEGDFGWEYQTLMKTHYSYSVSQLPCRGNSNFVFNLKVSPSDGSILKMPGGYIHIVTNRTVEKPIRGAIKTQFWTTFQYYVNVSVKPSKQRSAIISMEVFLKMNGLFSKQKVFNEIILPSSILPVVSCNKNIPDPTFNNKTFSFDTTDSPDLATENPFELIPGDTCIPQNIKGDCKTKGAVCNEADKKCYCEHSEYDKETKSCSREIIDGRETESDKKSNKKLITGICVAIGLGSFVVIVFTVVCYKYRQFKRRYSSDEVPIVDDDPPIDA